MNPKGGFKYETINRSEKEINLKMIDLNPIISII